MVLATNIVGIIGNIISLAVFLSPAPMFYGIIKKKAAEEADPYLFLFMCIFMNGYVWTFYCHLVKNTFVLISNIAGIHIVGLCLLGCVHFARDSRKRIFLLLGSVQSLQIVLMIVIILVAKLYFHSHGFVFVGIIADASSTIVYASHLAVWKKLVTTKGVECKHFLVSLAVLSNGICWTIYALLQFDIFVLVSSVVGAIFGAIELSLYAYFYFACGESSDVHTSLLA